MHTQRPQSICRRSDLPDWIVLPDIPELHLSIPTSRNQFSKATTLHVYVRDPLLMLAPHFDHSRLGRFPRVEDADSAVAVSGAEDMTGDLI